MARNVTAKTEYGGVYACGVTHENSYPKKYVSFLVRRPEGAEDVIDPEFVAVVVKNFGTFWVDIPVSVDEHELSYFSVIPGYEEYLPEEEM